MGAETGGNEALLETPEGSRVVLGGRPLDWFAGCGYLGMYGHPELLRAAAEATLRYGMRMVDKPGFCTLPPMAEVKRRLRELFHAEDSLYFSTGYAGNALLAAGLSEKFDHVFIDAESHYSVRDGAAVSGKPVTPFAHRDPDDLQTQIRRTLRPGRRPLLMSDGLFPISGAIAPVGDYRTVLAEYPGALLALDDAHGFGVLGEKGRGVLEYLGQEGEDRFLCATMSKAFGAAGGILPGSRELTASIRKHSGIQRGAGDPTPGTTAAAAKALEIVGARPEIRAALHGNIRRMRQGLHGLGLEVDPASPAPMIPLARRPGFDPELLHRRLFDEDGIYTGLVKSYTSAPAGGCLRIAVFATHTTEQIDRLIGCLGRLL